MENASQSLVTNPSRYNQQMSEVKMKLRYRNIELSIYLSLLNARIFFLIGSEKQIKFQIINY